MIYRFRIEIDIQADESPPWDAETVARDYLSHILDQTPLKDHVLKWQIQHTSFGIQPPTQAQQSGPSGLVDSHGHQAGAFDRLSQHLAERTWHTQRLPQEPHQPLKES